MQKTCLLETIDFSMTFVRFCQYISDQFYIFAEALVVAMTTINTKGWQRWMRGREEVMVSELSPLFLSSINSRPSTHLNFSNYDFRGKHQKHCHQFSNPIKAVREGSIILRFERPTSTSQRNSTKSNRRVKGISRCFQRSQSKNKLLRVLIVKGYRNKSRSPSC